MPGSRVVFADRAGPDKRNYRVDCDRIADRVPGFEPVWTVRKGIEELYAAYLATALTEQDLTGARCQRIRRIQELLDEGKIDSSLRRVDSDRVGSERSA